MANASKTIGKPEAIDLIYDEIMKVYNSTQKSTSKNKKKKVIKEVKEIKKETTPSIEGQAKVIGIKKR